MILPLAEQLSILVHLSKVDNFVAKEESDLIHFLGKLHGLGQDEIENIIDNPKPIPDLSNLDKDDKFEYLINIIQMMKVDGKVFTSEIKFSERIAMKLGFRPGVVADLSTYVYQDPKMITDQEFLKKVAFEHLING